jgi:hypothetical protein
MYSSADWSITPRPIYPADGRKVFDIYTGPLSLRPEIKQTLGEFPFPAFWGPAAGVNTPQGPAEAASSWIAAAAKYVEERHQPGLHLIYLPHLDYNLQRLGPAHPAIHEDLQIIDAIVGTWWTFSTPATWACCCCRSTASPRWTHPCILTECFESRAGSRSRKSSAWNCWTPGQSRVCGGGSSGRPHLC